MLVMLRGGGDDDAFDTVEKIGDLLNENITEDDVRFPIAYLYWETLTRQLFESSFHTWPRGILYLGKQK